jgi:murein tripeptide amidase MpaA
MQLVRIAGSTAQMRRLGEVEDLQFQPASAVRLDDDRWEVSGYASDEVLAEIGSRGLSTEVIADAGQVAGERDDVFAQLAQAATYPSTPEQIEARLVALADAHPELCTRTVLPHSTHEDRRVSSVRVAGGTGGRRVLFIGGAHAREWVPPDALLTLLERLLQAYADERDLEIPAFTDTAAIPDVSYGAVTIEAADVRRIVDGVELFVIALVNPDGRAFSQSSQVNAMWRKNRRPPPAGSQCRGVDANRNYDVAWDFERYYDDAGEIAVSASKDPCNPQVYIGPAAGSEPEVQNVSELLREQEIEFFVDVHSFARKLLFPWGMDDNQTRDPDQNYRNPAWDDRRDGGPGGPYGEFMSSEALERHVRIGRAMHDAIVNGAGSDRRARERSEYAVEPSLALYPTVGGASDYAFSVRENGSVTSFTMECGSDRHGEGGFQPVPAIYPKIEREVHLALLALLREAVGTS